MGQSQKHYILSLTEPFREDMRHKVAIAIANDLKSNATKMEKLLTRGGNVSKPMPLAKVDKLRKVFQRYNVPVAVYQVQEDGTLLNEDGVPVTTFKPKTTTAIKTKAPTEALTPSSQKVEPAPTFNSTATVDNREVKTSPASEAATAPYNRQQVTANSPSLNFSDFTTQQSDSVSNAHDDDINDNSVDTSSGDSLASQENTPSFAAFQVTTDNNSTAEKSTAEENFADDIPVTNRLGAANNADTDDTSAHTSVSNQETSFAGGGTWSEFSTENNQGDTAQQDGKPHDTTTFQTDTEDTTRLDTTERDNIESNSSQPQNDTVKKPWFEQDASATKMSFGDDTQNDVHDDDDFFDDVNNASKVDTRVSPNRLREEEDSSLPLSHTSREASRDTSQQSFISATSDKKTAKADSTNASTSRSNHQLSNDLAIGRSGNNSEPLNSEPLVGRSGKPLGRYGASSSSNSMHDFNRIPDDNDMEQDYDDAYHDNYNNGYDNQDYANYNSNNNYGNGDTSGYSDDYSDQMYQQNEQGNYYKEGERYRHYHSDNYGDDNFIAPRIRPNATFLEILSLAVSNMQGIRRYYLSMTPLIGLAIWGGIATHPVILGILLWGVLIFVQIGWQRIALKRIFGRQTSWSDFANFNANFINYALYQFLEVAIGLTVFGLLSPVLVVASIFFLPLRFIRRLQTPLTALFNAYGGCDVLYRKSNGLQALGASITGGFGQMRKFISASILMAILSFVLTGIPRMIITNMGPSPATIITTGLFFSSFLIAAFWLLPIFYLFTGMVYLQDHERDGDEKNIM